MSRKIFVPLFVLSTLLVTSGCVMTRPGENVPHSTAIQAENARRGKTVYDNKRTVNERGQFGTTKM